jgi:hypothetical protein
MTDFLRMSLEVKDVMDRHLKELKQYIPVQEPPLGESPEEILSLLERLSVICESSVHNVSCQLYEEALSCQLKIVEFLKVMNHSADVSFEDSEMGQILAHTSQWIEAVKSRTSRASLDEAWNFIAPVKPDRLEDLGNGLFEAKWWKPVPMMDVEILQRTSGLMIHGQPFEPKQLPGGISVRFSLEPCKDITGENP